MKKLPQISEAEYEVMKVIWKYAPINTNEITDKLLQCIFLPWNKGAHILDFNVGVFLITAVISICVMCVFLDGWASNNKYSLLSAVVLTGTMQVSGIVEAQTGAWNWLIIKGHVPAILAFLVSIVTGHPDPDDSMRSIRIPRIIFNTHYYNNKKVCLTIHISAVLQRV